MEENEIDNILEKANDELENGNYDKAIEICNQAISLDPVNPNIYLIQFLAENKIPELKHLYNCEVNINSDSYTKLRKYADKELNDILDLYITPKKVIKANFVRKKSNLELKRNNIITFIPDFLSDYFSSMYLKYMSKYSSLGAKYYENTDYTLDDKKQKENIELINNNLILTELLFIIGYIPYIVFPLIIIFSHEESLLEIFIKFKYPIYFLFYIISFIVNYRILKNGLFINWLCFINDTNKEYTDNLDIPYIALYIIGLILSIGASFFVHVFLFTSWIKGILAIIINMFFLLYFTIELIPRIICIFNGWKRKSLP